MKYLLYPHGGSGNHGCEAIVRSTKAIFGGEFSLMTSRREEDIRYGQRVKKFALEAEVDGKWVALKDELVEQGDGLTTIGHRRIVCFPTITATRLRFTIQDAKCEPMIKRTSIYLAPELTADIPDAGEKKSSGLHYFFSNPKQMMIDWDTEQTITSFRYLPPQNSKEGIITHYTLWASTDWANWTKPRASSRTS